jgi:hypothetical protein
MSPVETGICDPWAAHKGIALTLTAEFNCLLESLTSLLAGDMTRRWTGFVYEGCELA